MLADMDDLLFGSVDILTSPVVAAVTCTVKASEFTVGIAFTNSSEHDMGIAEFVDNEVSKQSMSLGVHEDILI